MNTDAEMPRYLCHKTVHALKIKSIKFTDGYGAQSHLVPDDEWYAPFIPSPGWWKRYRGGPGDYGYYVVYDDGYASWSPSRVFEEGYTLVAPQPSTQENG